MGLRPAERALAARIVEGNTLVTVASLHPTNAASEGVATGVNDNQAYLAQHLNPLVGERFSGVAPTRASSADLGRALFWIHDTIMHLEADE